MKYLNKKALSAAITGSLTVLICASLPVSYASDIEIYSNSTAGITTITMMLDTSGSMSMEQVGSAACDIPNGVTGSITAKTMTSNTSPSFTMRYCEVGATTETRFFYKRDAKKNNKFQWYSCSSPETEGSISRGTCNYTRSSQPDLIGYSGKRSNGTSDCNDSYECYYQRNINIQGNIYYDRLTRLKSAIFSLLSSDLIDSNKVALGIGQYSAQSNSSNTFTGADGSSGKILVPAKLLTNIQKNDIRNAIAGLIGSNGTPTANAYAEVAAYMLGTTTKIDFVGKRETHVYWGTDSAGDYYGTCVSWSGLNCNSFNLPSVRRQGREQRSCVLNWGNNRQCLVENASTNTASIAMSGFEKSISTSKQSDTYTSPLPTTSQCNGQGIYFLTDGNPNSSNEPTVLMKAALGSKGSIFRLPVTGTLPDGSESGHGMPAVGEFAKALRDVNRNPKGLEIKTAVVGFGSVFDVDKAADAPKPEADRIIRSLTDSKGVLREYYNCAKIPESQIDARNACNWGARSHESLPGVGGYGEGGFYSAQSSDEIIQSIVKFLDEVKPEFDPVATGSPTLPVDSLNPTQIQPYAYYASFVPKPQESTQLWVGNLNKYNVFSGQLFNKDNSIPLIKADGSLDKTADGYWDGGVLNQLSLRDLWIPNSVPEAQRTIYTNREVVNDSGTYVAQGTSNVLYKVDANSILSTTGQFLNDPDKNYWLNLLGYSVPIGVTMTEALLKEKPELRQMGSVLHSTPILLTQEGRVENNLTTTGRKDYLLFGSTQGLLHVLDSQGKEVFAFAPHEMMENQKGAFLSESFSTGGTNKLFYGIDAPWTVYSKYVTKADGTLTVYDAERSTLDDEEASSESLSDPENNLKGSQWVYGGLRMGGHSYYALDLTNIRAPKLKFHINPSATTASAALQKMGQSWSKPTLGYVNWNGQKKLVMFVGGGYDYQYETPNADPTETEGNGVYMFDANTGELLWWASNTELEDGNASFTRNANLKYSVVSQINAIDRNGDGLVDHLYFGDLGGQGFRADLNNDVEDIHQFGTRVVRLFNEHKAAGISPRFYEMPSVSLHQDNASTFAVVAFSSGNRSSPLAGKNNTTSAKDGVFTVFDNDVVRKDIYKSGISLYTSDVQLSTLDLRVGVPHVNTTTNTFNGGWISYYGTLSGEYKGMNDLFALDGILYVNVYHRDGAGVGGTCGAGVAGDSYLFQYCLPSGRCDFYGNAVTQPNKVKIGVGILGTGLGDAYNNAKNQLGLVVNRDETLDCNKIENKNLPECQLFDNSVRLKQLRWYETR